MQWVQKSSLVRKPRHKKYDTPRVREVVIYEAVRNIGF